MQEVTTRCRPTEAGAIIREVYSLAATEIKKVKTELSTSWNETITKFKDSVGAIVKVGIVLAMLES